jgi:hypothetical protein
MLKALSTLCLCLSIFGCSNGDKLHSHLADYQARMANVLNVDSINVPAVTLPNYPKIKNLDHQVPEQSIKLFEFYQLKHCSLYTLIAQRNTSLGRLQLPSTRFVYEKALLIALSDCIQKTTDPSLKESLQEWYAIKQQNIGASWASLMQFSSELKRTFSSNSGSIEGSKYDSLVQTKQALDFLMQVNQNPMLSSEELEKHLKNLNTQPLPAKLWYSQLLLTQHLSYLTPWLIQNTSDLNCAQGSKDKVKYLSNVFQLFFIEKIQPIAGQINNYHYQLSPIFEQLIQHPDLSVAYKQYIQALGQQEFAEYQQAMQKHIMFWQELFKRCNLSPKKN